MEKKRSEIRLSLVIIAISAFVVLKGFDAISQALSSADMADTLPAAVGQHGLEALAAPADVSGLRLYARADSAAPYLNGPLNLRNVGPANDAVTNVLRVWPLAGAYWIRLAEIRAASGGDMQSIIGAYQLSVLVGPFDGQMMVARQALGVQLWDVLSEDDRRSVLTDLASVWDMRPETLTEKLRVATASLSPEGRKSLKAELKARSRLRDQQLAVIGL